MNRLHTILITISFLLFYGLGYYLGQNAGAVSINAAQREYFYKGLAAFCILAPSPFAQNELVYTVEQCEDLYHQAVSFGWYEDSLITPIPFIPTAIP